MRQLIPVFFAIAISLTAQTSEAQEKLRALIIDGQNNHVAWPKTTVMMRSYLEKTGLFQVDVQRTQFTWKGGELLKQYPLKDGRTYEDLAQPKPDPTFKPNFQDYDVVVNNFGWNAATWPESTRLSFHQYVENGGGLVIVHAADNSFGDWDQYNRMIGLGGWGNRSEKTGPYVYVDGEGKTIRDMTPGAGGSHGPQHEFQIVIRDTEHPITKGLPRVWMHSQDELYQQLRGPADRMTILATAFADENKKGTGRHEPMMMTIDYGKGRIYHTPMGHADYSMECVGFITTFVRGTQWAATGEVTIDEIPADFPTATKPSQRAYTE